MNPILIAGAAMAAFMVLNKGEDGGSDDTPDNEPDDFVGKDTTNPKLLIDSRYFNKDTLYPSDPYFSDSGSEFADSLRAALYNKSAKFYNINLTTGQNEPISICSRHYLASYLKEVWDLLTKEKGLSSSDADLYLSLHIDEIIAFGLNNDVIRRENEKKFKETKDAEIAEQQRIANEQAERAAVEKADELARSAEIVRVKANVSLLPSLKNNAEENSANLRYWMEDEGVYLDDYEWDTYFKSVKKGINTYRISFNLASNKYIAFANDLLKNWEVVSKPSSELFPSEKDALKQQAKAAARSEALAAAKEAAMAVAKAAAKAAAAGK